MFWERQNDGDSKAVSGCQGCREGKINRWNIGFRATKLFCMVRNGGHMSLYIWENPWTEMNPSVNSELSVDNDVSVLVHQL